MASKKKFDLGKVKIPQIFKDFIAYAGKQRDFFAGEFEVQKNPIEYSIKNTPIDDSILDGIEDKNKQFLFFGQDGTGSSFAIWFYKINLKLEDAPIIFCYSEGGEDVVASNFREFLSLMALDWNFSYDDYEKESTPNNKNFRNWLKKKYQILPAKNPKELTTKARKQLPDLKEWFTGKGNKNLKVEDKKLSGFFTSWADYFQKNPTWYDILDKDIKEYLPINKMDCEKDGERYTYRIPSEGVNIMTKEVGLKGVVIVQIGLTVRDKKNNNICYKGSLPLRIQPNMNKEQVISLLGTPTSDVSDVGISYKKEFPYIAHVEFTKDNLVRVVQIVEPTQFEIDITLEKWIAGGSNEGWADYFQKDPEWWFNNFNKNINKCMPVNKMHAYFRSYTVPTEGVEISINDKNIITGISLILNKKYTYRNIDISYKGILPLSLQATMNEEEVIKLLGNPSKRTLYGSASIEYEKQFPYNLKIDFTNKVNGLIRRITLRV